MSPAHDVRKCCWSLRRRLAKPSLLAALDVASTAGHDRDPAHGSAAIAPAMASSNTGISNCGGRRLARRETCTAWSPSTAGVTEQMRNVNELKSPSR